MFELEPRYLTALSVCFGPEATENIPQVVRQRSVAGPTETFHPEAAAASLLASYIGRGAPEGASPPVAWQRFTEGDQSGLATLVFGVAA